MADDPNRDLLPVREGSCTDTFSSIGSYLSFRIIFILFVFIIFILNNLKIPGIGIA